MSSEVNQLLTVAQRQLFSQLDLADRAALAVYNQIEMMRLERAEAKRRLSKLRALMDG